MLPDDNFFLALSQSSYRKWLAYGLLSLPLAILLIVDSGRASVMGMMATGLFSAWFVMGIFGGAGEDVPEGEADFGINFILLGLLAYGLAFSMAMGAAGTASDAIAVGLLVLLGALIVLGVAPGIEASGDLHAGILVMVGAMIPVVVSVGARHVSPLLIYLGLLFSGSVIVAARLAMMSGSRMMVYGLLIGYVGLLVLWLI